MKIIKTAIRALPIVRSKEWLAEVRKEQCCICNAPPPSDPHHICGGYNGIKSSDLLTVPLCRVCHQEKGEKIEYFDRLLIALVRRMHRLASETEG